MILDRIAKAFENFDLEMDAILDEEQDRVMTAAISTGLAVRLVSYATGAKRQDAEAVALTLVRELATLKRQLVQGMVHDQ